MIIPMLCVSVFLVFFFNDTATTEIYTLSLHDALPILPARPSTSSRCAGVQLRRRSSPLKIGRATRLNSSHMSISYAVFCLKKKKKKYYNTIKKKENKKTNNEKRKKT